MIFSLFKRKKWPEPSFDEIKKRARILVIDDSAFPYERLFKRDGYVIERWSDVEDLPKLETGFFDIILLDIHGVGTRESEEQGFGILKHLRKVFPAQIIVAYSNADWSLKYQEFFDLADARLDKRQDYVDFKRVVDSLLRQRFSLGFYVDRIVKVLGESTGDTTRLREVVTDAILSRNLAKMSRNLALGEETSDKFQIALGVAQVAIGIASLFK